MKLGRGWTQSPPGIAYHETSVLIPLSTEEVHITEQPVYVTSCLNAHNHNTCIRLPQTDCTARKIALFIVSQDRQTQVLAANAMPMATTIMIDYNS